MGRLKQGSHHIVDVTTMVGLALTLLMLSACATTPPARVQYVPVNREVAVSCVPASLGPAPGDLLTPAQLAAIPDGPQRYVALAADWLNRVARMTETELVVKGCR